MSFVMSNRCTLTDLKFSILKKKRGTVCLYRSYDVENSPAKPRSKHIRDVKVNDLQMKLTRIKK